MQATSIVPKLAFAPPESSLDNTGQRAPGTPYRLDRVCKVDACAGNTLDVLWAPRGAKVWAALVEGGKAPVMLGDPKGPQAKALAEAATAPPAPSSAAPAATPPAQVQPAPK